MPRATVRHDETGTTEIIRDAHDESGKVTVKRTDFDDHILQNTKRHRLEQTLRTGDPFALHDGAEVIYHLQPPPLEWARFKKRYKGIYKALHSRDQITRESAVATIAKMYPKWITTQPGPAPRY